jgi:hypothetical protein
MEINGAVLPDGTFRLRLQATDEQGNASGFFDVSFTLDTTSPAPPAFDLAATSDTGIQGDLETESARVTLVGQTDPGSLLLLQPTGIGALAGGDGTFQIPGVALGLGANFFTLQATDLAGNTGDVFPLTITRIEASIQGDVVLTWNHTILEAIQADATAPPVATRALAMMHAAVYDVVNAIDGTPGYFVSHTAIPGSSPVAGIAAAAHDILAYLFPAQRATFDAQLAADLATVPDGSGEDDGVALGQAVAADMIALRLEDGWDTYAEDFGGTAPGEWRPTPPAFASGQLPQWAYLEPFVLESPDQFRPAGPPSLGSQTYADALKEVESLGQADSTTRTADQTEIARFWADGVGTYTPPGHWNEIADQLALEYGNSLSENARLFALLNVALADASIAVWDVKYFYEFWRPVTAIREADTDGNSQTSPDPT